MPNKLEDKAADLNDPIALEDAWTISQTHCGSVLLLAWGVMGDFNKGFFMVSEKPTSATPFKQRSTTGVGNCSTISPTPFYNTWCQSQQGRWWDQCDQHWAFRRCVSALNQKQRFRRFVVFCLRSLPSPSEFHTKHTKTKNPHDSLCFHVYWKKHLSYQLIMSIQTSIMSWFTSWDPFRPWFTILYLTARDSRLYDLHLISSFGSFGSSTKLPVAEKGWDKGLERGVQH